MRNIVTIGDVPTADQVGRAIRGLSEKLSDPKLNARLDEAVAGMPTEKEVIAYAQGGDVYIGRRPVQSLASWKKYGQEKKYKYLYKGFAYHGNERAQVVVFDDKSWDAQEIQRRKTNGFLGIHFYDLATGEDRQVTEWKSDTKVGRKNIGYNTNGGDAWDSLGTIKEIEVDERDNAWFDDSGLDLNETNAIWVTHNPHDALYYDFSAQFHGMNPMTDKCPKGFEEEWKDFKEAWNDGARHESMKVDVSGAVPVLDDGDRGYLYIVPVQKSKKKVTEGGTNSSGKKYVGRIDKDKLYIIKTARPLNPAAGYVSSGWFDEMQVVSPKDFKSGYFPRHQVVGEYIPKDSDIFTWSYTSSERFKGTELFDRVKEGSGRWLMVTGNPLFKKIDKANPANVTETEVSDVVMGRRISYTPIFLHKDAESLKEKIKEGLSAPWKQVQYSALGGDERGSFLIAVSLDKKENWQNGYLENSRYARFHLNNTGELEHFSGRGMGKFRKSRVKDVDSAIAKINSFIESQAESKSMSESEEINVGDTVKVDMGVVTKYDNLSQYLGLVRAAIKNGGGRVEVADIENGKAEIVGGPREKFLGGPWVPIEALRKMGATLAGGGESHGAGGFAT